MSDASDNSTTVNKYLVPVTTDNVLKWDGNTASLAGILHETFQFWEREGLFQEFLLTNAVPIKGGKLAVDSDLAIQFMDGTINDSAFRSTHKPCPASTRRLVEHNARLTIASYVPRVRLPTLHMVSAVNGPDITWRTRPPASPTVAATAARVEDLELRGGVR